MAYGWQLQVLALIVFCASVSGAQPTSAVSGDALCLVEDLTRGKETAAIEYQQFTNSLKSAEFIQNFTFYPEDLKIPAGQLCLQNAESGLFRMKYECNLCRNPNSSPDLPLLQVQRPFQIVNMRLLQGRPMKGDAIERGRRYELNNGLEFQCYWQQKPIRPAGRYEVSSSEERMLAHLFGANRYYKVKVPCHMSAGLKSDQPKRGTNTQNSVR